MIGVAEQPKSLPPIPVDNLVSTKSNGAGHQARLAKTLASCSYAGIEVVFVRPEWVDLRAPSELPVITPILDLVTELEWGLLPDVSEAISGAVREMLCNAIEYGGHLDPAALIDVRILRLEHAFICRIKDPGNGFDRSSLDHAAISNPKDNPVRHAFVREEKGLRGGGFGILLASQLVDHLVYNDQHNEVLIIKYLS